MHIIDLKVKNEDQLFNAFDKRHLTLSGDVISYLLDRYNSKTIGEDTLIRIESDNPVDIAQVQCAFSNYIDKQKRDIDRTLHINRLKMVRLFIIGVALVAAGIILSVYLNTIVTEIISIVGSVAIKDGATIWIEYNPEIRIQKMLLERMRETKIELAAQNGASL